MRTARTTLLLLLLLPLLGALPAFAEEETPKPDVPKSDTPKSDEPTSDEPAAEPKPEPKPEPDPEVPVYSIEFLMPGEDDAPEGWKLRDGGGPAGSPTEDVLEALSAACKCDLDEDTFYVETAVLKGDGAKIAFAMVDMDKSVWAFRQKVDAAAATNGWRVLELGAKGRLLIVGAGAKQAVVVDKLTEHVVYQLGHLAMERIRGHGGMQEEGQKAAIRYSEAVGRVAPDTGVAHAVVGVVHWLKARKGKKRGEKPDATENDKCAAAWRKAFAPGVKFPPKKSVLVFASGEYGQLLLEKKEKSVLEEATRVLKVAVAHEIEGKNGFKRFSNRYNLACCYARAGDVDEALKMLKGALETGKSMRVSTFRPQYINIRDKDPDMASLRDDPRFSKLMADFKPPEPPKGHGKKK